MLWWKFVGRTDEEIRVARDQWMTGDRFGEVKGYDGGSLPVGRSAGVLLECARV